MERVNLRTAVEILKKQGIEIKWDDNLTLENFLDYYDLHYAKKLEAFDYVDMTAFFFDDMKQIFSK